MSTATYQLSARLPKEEKEARIEAIVDDFAKCINWLQVWVNVIGADGKLTKGYIMGTVGFPHSIVPTVV